MCFFLAHLCAPYINTQKLKKKLQDLKFSLLKLFMEEYLSGMPGCFTRLDVEFGGLRVFGRRISQEDFPGERGDQTNFFDKEEQRI